MRCDQSAQEVLRELVQVAQVAKEVAQRLESVTAARAASVATDSVKKATHCSNSSKYTCRANYWDADRHI